MSSAGDRCPGSATLAVNLSTNVAVTWRDAAGPHTETLDVHHRGNVMQFSNRSRTVTEQSGRVAVDAGTSTSV